MVVVKVVVKVVATARVAVTGGFLFDVGDNDNSTTIIIVIVITNSNNSNNNNSSNNNSNNNNVELVAVVMH